MRLRKRVAFDRFLVRLEAVASGQWLLKGAYASLAGRLFERFVLDVGFRRKGSEPVGRVALPDGLAFAGVGSAEIGAIPVELQIAEKLHAYTRTFGGNRESSRSKDLVDLVLIAGSLPVDAETLRRAIEETFAERGRTTGPPSCPVRLPGGCPRTGRWRKLSASRRP